MQTTLCLKKVPPLQLAVIFTYTVRLRQFLAQMLPRKQAIKMYFIVEIWQFFDFSSWGRHHLRFSKFEIFNGQTAQEGQTASLCQIWSKLVKPMPKYGDFSIFPRWRPSAVLDLLCACSNHPQRAFGGLYHCAKFGSNQCRSFDNMHVFRFRKLAWKRLFTPPKLGFVGISPPKWGVISMKPKKARVHIVWAIMLENPLTHLICRWVLKRVYMNKLVIFKPLAQKHPMDDCAPNLAWL